MKLVYHSIRDESKLIVTNFNCGPSQRLLQDKGLYKILWAKDSARTITIDGYTVMLAQHEMIFCTPLHIIEIPEDDGLIALVFNREFYCIQEHDDEVSCNGFLFYGSSEPPVITLNQKEQKRFDALFFMLQEEFEMNDQIQGEMLRVLLKRLLIKSSRLIKETLPDPQIPKPQFDLVRQYHLLVEQHFKEKHQVADYAALLFKAPKTLSNAFKKSGNKSPLKIINERITLEAKRLLLSSSKTSEEITYELGFNDAGHFSKFFKKHVGMPPALFKKSKSAQ